MSGATIAIPARDLDEELRLLEAWGLGDEVAMWWVCDGRKRRFRRDVPRERYGRTPFCKRADLPAFPGERRVFRIRHEVTYRARLDGWEVEAPGTPLDGITGPWTDGVTIFVKPGDAIHFTFTCTVES